MRTAIALFTLSVREDAQRKRILPHLSLAANERLIAHLQQQTLAAAAQTSLPVVVIDAARQRGHSFAERLHNAFQDTFAAGFDRVLLIGADGAECRPELLQQAIDVLPETGQAAILGPDQRGGDWLIGLDRETFQQLDLASIPWHSSRVHATLTMHLQQSGATLLFAAKAADVNTHQDLRAFALENTTDRRIQALLRLKRALESTDSTTATNDIPLPDVIAHAAHILRGPPQAA
jgi:glycosyltransferase A (GT-A) superfamily protein (DUF2064 family)